MLTSAVRVPVAEGLNLIWKLVLVFCATFVLLIVETTSKSSACPEIVMTGDPVRNKFVSPEFVTVNVLIIGQSFSAAFPK